MWLTNRQRIQRLCGDLLRRPQSIPRYVAHLPVWRRQPLDLALPWWSYGAMDFLRGRLLSSMEVFEFGTGGSTLFLAQRCRSIVCVEDSPAWRQAVLERLAQRTLTNCRIELRPLPSPADRAAWDAYLDAMTDHYDVIVVDGNDPVEFGGEGQCRKICFAEAEKRVRPGGMIIVDDSWRYTSLRGQHSAKQLRVFEGTGPCRVGVTSTDVYCY